MRAFPVRTALTIAMLAVLLAAISRAVHGVSTASLATASSIVEFTPDQTPPWPWRPHAAPATAEPVRSRVIVARYLQDEEGSLDHFYESLWRTERREANAVTRILHYGDSPTTADLITGDTRQSLQARFGNAGHGFTLIGKPWAWYEHRGIELSSRGWQMDPGTRWDLRNGNFGLGGVAFSAHAPAYSRIRFSGAGQKRLEVWFMRQPQGGSIQILADGQPVDRITTVSPARQAGFAQCDLPGGTKTLELDSEGEVRIFGITLEKANTGVVYDSVGMNGASVSVLALIFNERHWAEQLRHRGPDLVIINYGTNESSFAAFLTHEYEKELRESIRRIRAALPDTSILVMSPMDRGQNNGGEIETLETIPRIVEIQRRVAADMHCGFFNTYEVMGGEGTMARWYESRPRLVSADFIHPTPQGARLIANAFVKELMAGLGRYKLRHVLPPSALAEVR